MAECNVCGSLRLLDAPENLAPYYPSDYYSFQELSLSGSFLKFLKRVRFRLFRSGLSFLSPIYGNWMLMTKAKLRSKIADMGCGNGQLLYEMHAAGFSNLKGFDPFLKEDIEIAPGLSLHKKSIFDIEEQFDLIMMHHSLEHMPDPEEVLEKCYSLLTPNGFLLVRIPVTDSQVWIEEGANWVQLDVPRHLHIPSCKGLKSLASKVGFQLKGLDFDSYEFQFWATSLNKKGVPLKNAVSDPRAHFSKNEWKDFHKKSLLFNQKGIGDQACFYFQKLD